jgi:alanine transaminase
MTLIRTSIRKYTPVMSSVGEHIKNAQYAVRGAIPIRGQEIAQQLKTAAPGTFGFSETSFLNIGNPQQCGQGNLTFNRQVIAGLSYPPLA